MTLTSVDKSMTKTALLATMQAIEAYHCPRYPISDPGDPARRVVCNGCEVFWWPCPTIQIIQGTWLPEASDANGTTVDNERPVAKSS